jgi:hypothetical protein
VERHRIFRLDARLSLMGMEVDDWFVLLGGWVVMLQVAGLFLGPRPRLVIATAVSGLLFLAYRRLKDRLPGKFARHLVDYMMEADAYRVTPDEVNVPYIVPLPSGEVKGVREGAAAGGRRVSGF